METLGDTNKIMKKKKVIRVVKKIVKKKVIKKVPKPKPESKTECLDSFGSNETSDVMDIEKTVEKGDSSYSDGIEVVNVKEGEEKGVCLVENGYSCDQDRIEVKIEKYGVVGDKLSEFEEKGVCLVQNDGFRDKERGISSNSSDNDAMKIEKLGVGADKLREFENVKEEGEKRVCLVQTDGLRYKERGISYNSIDNDGMEIEKRNVVAEKLSAFENVKEVEEEEKGVCLVQNDGFSDKELAISSNLTDNDGMEIEKRNVVEKKLSEFGNVKEIGVSDKDIDALCEKYDLSVDETEISSLVTSSLVSDQNGVELQDGDDNGIELQISDQNRVEDNDAMDVKVHKGEEGVKELVINDKDIDARLCERIGLSVDESEIDSLVTSYLVSDQNGVELQDTDQNETELQINDHNRVEDNDAMDVIHEGEEGVKEVVVNDETEGTELQQGLNESSVLSGQTVASWWHTKQRRKIFVHGFDKETKEDDIREVFEKIGEVVEVKLITNFNSGKSRGFGFVRYASADLADLALTKFRHVEIRGSTWHTAAVEASDTIVLNNIDKKWNSENVLSLLQKVGITKIDEVSVVPDLENTELNRGFAFIEFETKRDAQMAYRKLQIKNVFGEYSKIKVVWAESLVDPVEEEMHNVKSVFAEYIPSSWDEKEVKDHFKMYGEIESIALGKNLHSAKRNDFAFINYKTCQAAVSCIEALNTKRSTSENGPKAHLKVSLAKSIPRGKTVKTKSESAVTEASKVHQLSKQSRPSRIRYENSSQSTPYHSSYQNASQSRPSHSPYQYASQSRPSQSPYQNASQSRPSHSRYQNVDQLRPSQGISGVYQPQKAIRSEVPSIVRHEASRKDEGSSTTNELVQLLREQASWKLGGPSSTAGMSTGHPQSQSGGQQQLPTDLVRGRNALYLDPRSYHQTHLRMPNPTQPRLIVASPHYDQQRAHYTHGYNVVEPNPRYIQKRDQATYPGNGRSFYR